MRSQEGPGSRQHFLLSSRGPCRLLEHHWHSARAFHYLSLVLRQIFTFCLVTHTFILEKQSRGETGTRGASVKARACWSMWSQGHPFQPRRSHASTLKCMLLSTRSSTSWIPLVLPHASLSPKAWWGQRRAGFSSPQQSHRHPTTAVFPEPCNRPSAKVMNGWENVLKSKHRDVMAISM